MPKFDAAIIGGGPAGLSAALSLVRVRRRIIIFDSGAYRNAPAQQLHNFWTRDGANNAELRRQAQDEIRAYGTAEFVFKKVMDVHGTDGAFQLHTASGTTYEARKLVLAGGTKDLMLDDVEGLKEVWDKGKAVHCMFCHGYENRDKKLAQLGLNPMVVHVLGGIGTLSKDVTVLTNEPVGASDPKLMDSVKSLGFSIIEGKVESTKLTHDDDKVEIAVKDAGKTTFDVLLWTPNTTVSEGVRPLLDNLGLQVKSGSMPINEYVEPINPMGKTSVPGVFVAGDIQTPMKSVSMALASGSIAGAFAHFDFGHL